MYKVSFNNEAIAEDYISGLIRSGMRCVRNIAEISRHSFCVIENDVYFTIG